MSGLLDVYNSHLAELGAALRPVSFSRAAKLWVMQHSGLTMPYELLVKTEDGAVHQVISGRVFLSAAYTVMYNSVLFFALLRARRIANERDQSAWRGLSLSRRNSLGRSVVAVVAS